MKNSKKDQRLIEETKKTMVSLFLSPCPRCGNPDTEADVHFDESMLIVPVSIDITCPDCGRSTVKFDPDSKGWSTEDGAPYDPMADDIYLTRYHRFDPRSYEDEKDAVRDEIEIVEGCLRHRSGIGDGHAPELASRLSELYERGCELGIENMVSKHVLNIIQNHLIDEPDKDIGPVIDRCLPMIEKGGFIDWCIIMTMTDNMVHTENKLRRIRDEARSRILSEVNGLKGGEDDVSLLLAAHFSFEQIRDPCGKDILGKAIAFEKENPDEEERDRMLAYIYGKHILYLASGPQMEEEMQSIERYRDRMPFEYMDAAIHYLQMTEFGDDRKDSAMEKTDYLLTFLNDYEENNEDPDELDIFHDYDRMRIHQVRYIIGGDKEDLIKAAEHAVECIGFCYDDEEAEITLRECLDDPKMPKKVSKRLVRKTLEYGFDLNSM